MAHFRNSLENSNSNNVPYSLNYHSATMCPVEFTVPSYTQFHQKNKTDWKLMSTDHEMAPDRNATDWPFATTNSESNRIVQSHDFDSVFKAAAAAAAKKKTPDNFNLNAHNCALNVCLHFLRGKYKWLIYINSQLRLLENVQLKYKQNSHEKSPLSVGT